MIPTITSNRTSLFSHISFVWDSYFLTSNLLFQCMLLPYHSVLHCVSLSTRPSRLSSITTPICHFSHPLSRSTIPHHGILRPAFSCRELTFYWIIISIVTVHLQEKRVRVNNESRNLLSFGILTESSWSNHASNSKLGHLSYLGTVL